MDIRHHSPNRAHDPVRWIFFVDVVDGQEQRLHGKSAATEFLSRRTCTRGSDCDSVPGVSDPSGCGGSARLPAVVRTARRAALCDSYFGWILSLRTATEYHEGRWSGFPDLFGRSRSRHCRGHSWRGTAQSSSTGLRVESAHIMLRLSSEARAQEPMGESFDMNGQRWKPWSEGGGETLS